MLLTLILMVPNQKSPRHLRPITCCNVAYKAITKINVYGVKFELSHVLELNQGVFIENR